MISCIRNDFLCEQNSSTYVLGGNVNSPTIAAKSNPQIQSFSHENAVANLYIIDHSLKISGGHHLDYARCIALAGQEQGFRTTLGTHRSFTPEIWQAATAGTGVDDSTVVRPVFRETVYQADSYLAGLQKTTRSQSVSALIDPPKSGWFNRLKSGADAVLHQRRRQLIALRFADGCAEFFRGGNFNDGDHVFLAGISELELNGLALFLKNNLYTTNAKWHVQFHFNLFDGRPDEYPAQRPIAKAVSASMLEALRELTHYSIDFYTTSTTLADQYNSLGVVDFGSLPYPIAAEFRRSDRVETPISRSFANSAHSPRSAGISSKTKSTQAGSTDDAPRDIILFPSGEVDRRPKSNFDSEGINWPLKLVCPGGIRREKGQQDYLQTLVNDLWESHLSNGKVQLVLQRSAPKWPAKAHKIDLTTPADSADSVEAAESSSELPVSPIEYVNHPLPNDEYVDLIHSTDIGLLFYNSHTYYGRRAGILGELLACGKPVIVSSGSWLSDQLEEANFSYADRVVKSREQGRVLTVEQLEWNRSNLPLAGGVVSFDQGKHCFEFDVYPEGKESVASISFAWHWPKAPGIYCRIELEQFDESGRMLNTNKRVVGVRQRRRNVNALFNLHPQATRVCFTLKNAFGKSSATIHHLTVTTLLITEASNQPIPIGVVGLAAADVEDLASCVSELESNYHHYARSAKDFSVGWNANHDPALTIEHLVDRDRGFRRIA